MDPTGAKLATIGGSGCHAIATCKNDSSRVYMVFCSVSNPFFGFNQFPLGWSTVYRSDDGAQTWKATAFKTVQAQDSNASNYAHTSSPKMYVDPANKDICYLSMAGGFFFVTYNGGDNWHPVMTMLNAWPHATATNDVAASVSPGPINFSAIPSDVLTFNSNTFGLILYAYNLGGGGGPDGLGPLSLGSNGLGWDNGGVNSTQFQPSRIAPRDGTTTSSPGVLTGDVIYFGAGGLVVIDDSNGTVTNPGIAQFGEGSGLASKNVFFASLHPAFLGGAVWLTTDGNPEHATATTGGPTNAANIKVSNDKALVGGGNCVYLTTVGTQANQNIWRYVGTNAPGTTGFTPNAWVNCGVTVNNGQNNGAQIAAPDPTTAGRLGIIPRDFQGSVALSTDYGGSLAGQNPPTFTSAAGQPAWITVSGTDGAVVTSDAWMDPLNSGHLIWLSGIAVYDSVPAAGSGAVAANNVTAGLESLVVQKILKAPAPNGRILIACEDRPIFSTANASTYPANANPVTGQILQAGDVVYADDDPTVVFGGFAASVTRSQDSGLTFITIGTINTLNAGTITAFGIFGNPGSGYVPGTYTNVPLTTSGLGTGGTADVVIGAGGSVTSFTVNQGGDVYAVGDSVSVNNSHLGGSGSGLISGISNTAPLKTTNGSNVVIVTSIAHGYSTGRTVGLSRSTAFNNVNIEGLIQTITVTDANHYTMTASTNANATGFGSAGVVEGLNGYIPPTDTQTGGSPTLGAPTKLNVVHADVSAYANLQVGIATGDPSVVANWAWKNCLAPVTSGSPFTSIGNQDYANDFKLMDTDGAGNVYWLDVSNGFIYKSTDGWWTKLFQNCLDGDHCQQCLYPHPVCPRQGRSASHGLRVISLVTT